MIDENKNLAFQEEKSTIRPLVSVCISVYNGEDHLRKCLDSVLSQDISSMEIVLVNDGSTDGTSVHQRSCMNTRTDFRKSGSLSRKTEGLHRADGRE